MSLFDFILSLLLVFNPGLSDSDFNDVYSLLDDTSIHSVVVDDSAFDKLSQLGDSGVMPLDFTAQDSGRLQHIMEALYQNGSPSMISVFDRLTEISNSLGYRTTNSTLYSQLVGITTFLDDYLVSIDGTNSSFLKLFKQLFDVGGYYMRHGNDMLALTTAIRDKLSSIDIWQGLFPVGFFDPVSGGSDSLSVSPLTVFVNLRNNVLRALYSVPGSSFLTRDGPTTLSIGASIPNIVGSGFLALDQDLLGRDRKTAFAFLAEDITKDPTVVEVDNILDALGHIGTQLQNPLQRLAYVFANPLDLEVKENVTENTELANDNFLKPGSPGSVKPSDIGEAADFASGASDFLQTGASPSDAFSGLSQGSDNWSFFSQQAMDDMLGNPTPAVASDDIPYELGEDGFYHILPSHLFEVESKLGKGG